jgi:hypothetical protein
MREKLRERFNVLYNVTRIETGETAVGVPDLHMRTYRHDVWIELKVVKQLKSGQVKIPFRPGQFNWIRRHTEMRGKALLLCYVDKPAGFWIAFKGTGIKRVYESQGDFLDSADWYGTWAEVDPELFDSNWSQYLG